MRWERWSATNLLQSVPLFIPTFFNNKEGYKNDSGGPSTKNLDRGSLMPTSSVVPNHSENVIREICSYTTPYTSSVEPKKNYNRSCLYSFTFKVLGEGISQWSSKYVQVKGEKVHYEITIFLCQIALIDVVKEIWFILIHCRQSFVLFRLLAWSSFWVKNNWLSVIFVYHDYVGNKTVGELPYVCDLLKGMFTQRPP